MFNFEDLKQGHADLSQRINALESDKRALEAKLRAANSADQRWKAVMRTRADLVFRNATGALARMPLALAQLLADGGSFDGQVVDDGDRIRFVPDLGAPAVAIPKTLFCCLEDVLEAWFKKYGLRSSQNSGQKQ